MYRGLAYLITLTLSFAIVPSAESNQRISSESIKLQVDESNIEKTLISDGKPRGPALGVLADGSLLLGGGSSGGSIFLRSSTPTKIKEVGRLIASSQRKRDSRFAITDIAVLHESSVSAQLLVSYPRLGTGKSLKMQKISLAFDFRA